ncbi:hypothetical protein BDZ91DRAFT_797901 [Kalaharituber pfeilii]|nr:hypothetical protein BDZ91DRAFT_797901 [Kalaharituber pfeilii]
MLRRIKNHVQKELRDKIELDIYCNLTYRQRALYKSLRDKICFLDVIEKASRGGEEGTQMVMNLVMQLRNKPTSTIAQEEDDDEDSDAEDDKPANAGKEKFKSANGLTFDAASDDDDVSNYSEVDDTDAAIPKMEKPIGKLAKKTSTAAPSKFDTRPAKVARGKRSATAGANYCKLKIRTQGGIKGRAGHGRFGNLAIAHRAARE